MFDWIVTALVLIIGVIVMVTGLIKYLFIIWILCLLILVVFSVLGRIWGCNQISNDK